MSRQSEKIRTHHIRVDRPANAVVIDRPSSGDRLAVTVVVPLFNEEETLPSLAVALDELGRAMLSRYRVTFILVDDGSTDNTQRVAMELFSGKVNVQVISHKVNQGIAAAIMTGVRHASAEMVCSIDADCSYEPQLLLDMIPRLREGVDVVTASPYHAEGAVLNAAPWRIGLSRIASRLYRTVLRNKLTCYTCCVRVYRGSVVRNMELSRGGFAGITELLWRLDRAGSRFDETPAVMGSRKCGASKLRLISTIVKHLGLLAQIVACRAVDRLWGTSRANCSSAVSREEQPVFNRPVSRTRSTTDSSKPS